MLIPWPSNDFMDGEFEWQFQYNIDNLVTGSKDQLWKYGSEFSQHFTPIKTSFTSLLYVFAIVFIKKQYGLLKNPEKLGFVIGCWIVWVILGIKHPISNSPFQKMSRKFWKCVKG